MVNAPRTAFKHRLNAREPLLGTFVKMNSLEIIEILGLAGFDFVIADMEHTSMSLGVVENMVRVADLHGMSTIVRVPDLMAHSISRSLDLGVAGIQVPQIEDESQVHEAVQCAKYPPIGKRGVSYSHRAATYGFGEASTFLQRANEDTVLVVHVETESSYQNVEKIVAVDGLDVIFIGPTDLSVSLGVTPSFIDGGLVEPVRRILEAARTFDKKVGIVVGSLEEYDFAIKNGIPYIVWGSDVALFKSAVMDVKRILNEFRAK